MVFILIFLTHHFNFSNAIYNLYKAAFPKMATSKNVFFCRNLQSGGTSDRKDFAFQRKYMMFYHSSYCKHTERDGFTASNTPTLIHTHVIHCFNSAWTCLLPRIHKSRVIKWMRNVLTEMCVFWFQIDESDSIESHLWRNIWEPRLQLHF